MKNIKMIFISLIMCLGLTIPSRARADFWGGDVVVLTQILANALQQLIQLKQILSTGSDSLELMRDINRGIKDGLTIIRIINPNFNPGIFGSLNSADQVLNSIQSLYGQVPVTPEARLQQAQDQSVSESIAMNGTLFQFADQADQESRRIIDRSQEVNPKGAAKLTAQSIAVLISVSTQVLRTNSMMLKMMAENMALQNKKEKLQSAQFKTEYDGISSAMRGLPKEINLKPLNSGGN